MLEQFLQLKTGDPGFTPTFLSVAGGKESARLEQGTGHASFCPCRVPGSAAEANIHARSRVPLQRSLSFEG